MAEENITTRTAEKLILERKANGTWQMTVYDTEGEVMQTSVMGADEEGALRRASDLAQHFKAALVVKGVGAGEAE